jgi:PAS domain S-box-containing protein
VLEECSSIDAARFRGINNPAGGNDWLGLFGVNPFLDALDVIGATPRMFLDKLRVGISLVDARYGEIIFANEEFARIVGYSCDALLNEKISFLDLTYPDDRERNAILQKRLQSGEIDHYQLEKRYLRRDGSIIWASVTVDTIQRSGDVTWSIALVEDISARKILEQQLDAAETVATLATWNWAVKSDTSTISPSYNSLHGLPKATPAPSLMEAMRHVHPDDRTHFQETISRGLATRSGYTEEYRIIQANGRIRWLRTTATCLYDAAGEVANLIGATIDITDVKTRQRSRSVSAPIRNILRHIERHWNEAISLKELGRLYGISPRSIHNYFAAEGTTPNKHIKKTRLQHARQRLLGADAETTVTAVALQCCFSNLGHFAKDYRAEFGEAPSDTIRSRK